MTRSIRVELTVKTALITACAVGAVWLLTQLWQVLFVVIVALMLVGMLNPLVERLEGRGVRRGRAIAIVFTGVIALAVGFCLLTLPRIFSQASDLVTHLPQAREKLARELDGSSWLAPVAPSVRALEPDKLGTWAKELGLTYGMQAVTILGYALSTFFLALYLVVDRDRMRGSLFAVVPRKRHVRLSHILRRLEAIVGGYLRGQALTSLLMAIFTFLVLTIAGVPNALALALLAGLADVLPYVGAILACGPAVLMALTKGMTVAIVVGVLLGAYQELENRIIIPRIYGRVLRLPGSVVLIALLVGGTLLGVLGAVLALPITAALRMLIEELRVQLPGDAEPSVAQQAMDEAAEETFESRAAGLPPEEAAVVANEIAADVEDMGAPTLRDPVPQH